MKLTVKLYAGLKQFLPDDAQDNAMMIEIDNDATINSVLERFSVPAERAHLVLLNGVYINPEERDARNINDGDTLSIWPPVFGG